MGAISTIRKHYAIVVGLIGVAIAAFILTDILSPEGGGPLFTPDDTVGKVGDHEISYQEFERRLRISRENYIQQTGETRMSTTRQLQIENQAWDELIEEIVLQKELEGLALSVTDQELVDMVDPDNPHQVVRDLLTDRRTGRFDAEQFRRFLAEVQQNPQLSGQLIQLENALEQAQLQNKYLNLVEKGFFTTDLEARDAFINENKTADAEFFGINTDVIDDDDITVSDREIRRYYDRNQDKYEQDQSRDFRFVTFEIQPSSKDSQRYRDWVESQIEPFKNTEDDSSFVDINSDEEQFPALRNITELDEGVRNDIIDAEVGDVLGPYLARESYNITKLLGKEEDTVYSYYGRNIFIDHDYDGDAGAFANELLNRVLEGEDFNELALEHGMDEYAFDGGEFGWFREGQRSELVELKDYMHELPVGVPRVVETDRGFHVLEVLHEPIQQLFKTATVARSIIPSSDTYADLYDVAYEFSREARSPESFETLAEERGLRVREATDMNITDQFVTGIGPAREVVNWSFESSEDDVSTVFELDESYVVGYVSRALEEGVKPLEEVRDEVLREVRREKKLDEIAALLRDARTQDAVLANLAAEFDANLHTSSDLTFKDNSVPAFGRQPKLIGGFFGLNAGMVSFPVKGEGAVFMTEVHRFSDVQLPEDLRQYREGINNQRRNYAARNTFDKLRDVYPITDRRYEFY